MFSFDSVLCHFLTCNVLNFIAMSKNSLVSWLLGFLKKLFWWKICNVNMFCSVIMLLLFFVHVCV